MAEASQVDVTFKIEPIVKILCHNGDCDFNYKTMPHCRLKSITVDKEGVCKHSQQKVVAK